MQKFFVKGLIKILKDIMFIYIVIHPESHRGNLCLRFKVIIQSHRGNLCLRFPYLYFSFVSADIPEGIHMCLRNIQ